MRVSFNFRVRRELIDIVQRYIDIVQRYEAERIGLGGRFADTFEAVVSRILANPELFGLVGSRDRMADLAPFPYGVVFHVIDDVVRIKCVRHHHRHPRYGFGRR